MLSLGLAKMDAIVRRLIFGAMLIAVKAIDQNTVQETWSVHPTSGDKELASHLVKWNLQDTHKVARLLEVGFLQALDSGNADLQHMKGIARSLLIYNNKYYLESPRSIIGFSAEPPLPPIS